MKTEKRTQKPLTYSTPALTSPSSRTGTSHANIKNTKIYARLTMTTRGDAYLGTRSFQGGDEIEAYLCTCRRILRALGGYSASRLREAKIELGNPDGGFYLLPDFRAFEGPLKRSASRRATNFPKRF